MGINVEINRVKEVALWKPFTNDNGEVLGRFKVRGIEYKPYQVALERATNHLATKGYDVAAATAEDELYHELLFKAAAYHLIEDWDGVTFIEDGEKTEVPYTGENAYKLFKHGDIGFLIWSFIKQHAESIQAESNKKKEDLLGK